MRLLDTIVVRSHGQARRVELFHGDLSNIPPEHAVDALVVSAFPGSYAPSPGTLILSLSRVGVSVDGLAQNMAADLRPIASCWLSRPVTKPAGLNFRRILCFEPRTRRDAPSLVGDIFRAILPFTSGPDPIRSLAMPIVASGNQRVPADRILAALLEAAIHWFERGIPLEVIKIVIFHASEVGELWEVFRAAKARVPEWTEPVAAVPVRSGYDLFVSYSQQNRDDVDGFVARLRECRPDVRLFLDRIELHPGVVFQQRIHQAIETCTRVVAMLSPPYLTSKACQEEWYLAHFRDQEEDGNVLVPVYLHTAALPLMMRARQYLDCREADPERLADAARRVAAMLG